MAALIVAGGAALAVAAPASQAVVDERVTGMKSLIGSMRGATGAGDPAEARASLAPAIAYARSLPSRFPKGTGIGDPGITKTRAKQDIWTRPDAFKTATGAFLSALEAASAAADDSAKFDAAMGDVKKSCSSCHDAFRGPATD